MASTSYMVLELLAHVDSNSTRLTANSNLFANDLPFIAGPGVALIESPGSPPGWHHGPAELPGWERPSLQAIARTSAPSSGASIPIPVNAKRMLADVVTILGRIQNQAVNGSTYMRVAPLQSPFLARIEADDRQTYAVNFEVWRVPST